MLKDMGIIAAECLRRPTRRAVWSPEHEQYVCPDEFEKTTMQLDLDSAAHTTITFDEEQFVGSGLYLFASVIERFLGVYASLNSFNQLVLKTEQREGEVKRWRPRTGERRRREHCRSWWCPQHKKRRPYRSSRRLPAAAGRRLHRQRPVHRHPASHHR